MNTPLKRGLVLVLSLMASQCTSPAYANTQKLLTATANAGNNAPQELQNLLKPVQHRTIADVFLCPSFASLSLMDELRLARALVRLWWGGSGNKPFMGEYRLPLVLAVLNLPTALHLGQIIKKTTLQKG
ncbi:MAG: hypothetical protein Q7S87_05920 [Agitococcus sp.]|nr:hypothetical protein [Agitococcus sp.]